MRLLICTLLILASISCSTLSTPPSSAQTNASYAWKKVLDEGPWSKSYNFQMLVIDNRLWVFHPDGVWWTSDGSEWQRSDLTNPIGNHAFLDYVYFKGALYGLGHFNGNIETFTFRPEVYRTRDLTRWETIARKSNLPRRFFYHPFVFQDKIWIIGGEDSNVKYADVWNSPDGVAWTKVKDNLPFGRRSGSQIVTLRDKLYLLGNDVWMSSNGVDWQRVTAEIVKGEQIFGYNAVVYDDRIWLLGCNRNGQFSSQVLVSADGRNWLPHDAPWTPRGGIAAAVFNDSVYMTGGKYGGTPDRPNFVYSNDLWTLSKR